MCSLYRCLVFQNSPKVIQWFNLENYEYWKNLELSFRCFENLVLTHSRDNNTYIIETIFRISTGILFRVLHLILGKVSCQISKDLQFYLELLNSVSKKSVGNHWKLVDQLLYDLYFYPSTLYLVEWCCMCMGSSHAPGNRLGDKILDALIILEIISKWPSFVRSHAALF